MGTDSNQKPEGQAKVSLSGVYDIRFRAEPTTFAEVRAMVADPTLRVNSVADVAVKDPILVAELIKASSSMQYSEGKPPVTTLKAALERLGEKGAIETLELIKTHPEITDPRVSEWVEIIRDRSRRAGMMAKIVAEAIATGLGEDCHVAGTLLFYGEMLAPAFFGKIYTDAAEALPRSKILYKLEKEHNFDVKKVGLTYLKKLGLPELILFALDEAGQTKVPARGPMKQVLSVTEEMILHFDSEKWEKLAPGQNLPPKSPIRLMRITEVQYLKLYDKLTEYLQNDRLAKEQAANAARRRK